MVPVTSEQKQIHENFSNPFQNATSQTPTNGYSRYHKVKKTFPSEEPFLKPISDTCKAPLRAWATVQEAMEFSDALASRVALPEISLFSKCKKTL